MKKLPVLIFITVAILILGQSSVYGELIGDDILGRCYTTDPDPTPRNLFNEDIFDSDYASATVTDPGLEFEAWDDTPSPGGVTVDFDTDTLTISYYSGEGEGEGRAFSGVLFEFAGLDYSSPITDLTILENNLPVTPILTYGLDYLTVTSEWFEWGTMSSPQSITLQIVPEPATLLLLGLGTVLLRKKR